MGVAIDSTEVEIVSTRVEIDSIEVEINSNRSAYGSYAIKPSIEGVGGNSW